MYIGQLEAVTNREDWIDQAQVTDGDTGTLVDLSAATIAMDVRDQKSKCRVLTATLANSKISLVSTGIFEWTFTAADMHGICAGTYDVGITVEIADVTKQLFVGTVSIVDGVMD